MSNYKGMWGWIAGGTVVVALAGFGAWQWLGGSGNGQGIWSPSVSSNSNATTSSSVAVPVSISQIKPSGGVSAVVASLPDATRFQALFAASGVASQLTGKGPYTVFVPTDGAFAYLPPNALQALTASEKDRLVEYHVVKGRALDVDAVSSGSIQALSGDTLNFQTDLADHTAQVNSGWVIQEFKANNGVVYTISSVLLPPAKTR